MEAYWDGCTSLPWCVPEPKVSQEGFLPSSIFRVASLVSRLVISLVLIGAAACGSSPTEPSRNAVPIPGQSTLVFEGATFTSAERPRMEQLVRDAVGQARTLIPIERITVIVRFGEAGGVIPQLGLGGRADAGTVTMTIDPDSPVWVESLDTEFFRVLAHELHHIARFRSVGFSKHLLDAMVAEGLADQFMIEFAGDPPPIWATALTGAELDTWLDRAQQEWLRPQYDHAAWFFLDPARSIPHWTGYAVGFEITNRFLAANLSERASTLFDEPATSFIPPTEMGQPDR